MDGTRAVAAHRVRVDAGLEQREHDVELPLVSRLQQRRIAGLVGHAREVRVAGQFRSHGLQVAVARRLDQPGVPGASGKRRESGSRRIAATSS